MADRQKSLEHALEDAVSRALRDNLAPLQRTADDLHQAYADLVAACSSSRPSNALPAMLRAQTAASSLAAGLSVLSNFVAVALNPGERRAEHAASGNGAAIAEAHDVETVESVERVEARASADWIDTSVAVEPSIDVPVEVPIEVAVEVPLDVPLDVPGEIPGLAQEPVFDISTLSSDLQDLHRRANRVAKVTMQDIKLLHPEDVRLAREQKNICGRMRSDIDKARKEYDRRFRSILDHPVDYFHRWMVEILAEGNVEALGEYPYPSPVLRQ